MEYCIWAGCFQSVTRALDKKIRVWKGSGMNSGINEKRRSKRLDVDLHLNISSLFKQDNIRVDNIEAPIEVINISKNGIGFKSGSILPVDYYFNAKLQLGAEDSSLYCVVKIIRQEAEENGNYMYGAEFVGMPSVLLYIFDEFEERVNSRNLS